ncbi:replication initiation protein [Fusobacterium ulcerans]|uniref:replication initiation protein n=1 Tax=Fusobacterium ulcerans TaxID=861 RepID=UPI003A83B794
MNDEKFELKHHKDFHRIQFQDYRVKDRNLIFALCYKLMEQESDTIELNIKEISKISNYKPTKAGDNIYRSLEEAYKRIKNASIYVKKENGVKHFVLFTTFETFEDEGIIRIEVNKNYRYLLNNVTAPFTIQSLLEYTNLSSNYSQLTYSLLKEWEKVRKLKISLEDFKTKLGVPASYDTPNFNRQILKPILKELPQYFKNLNLEKIKTGNKVTHLKFTWEKGKDDYIEYPKESNVVEIVISEELSEMIEKTKKNRFIAPFLKTENIENLLDHFDEQALIFGLDCCRKKIKKEIASINYLLKAIETECLKKVTEKKLVVKKEKNTEIKLENGTEDIKKEVTKEEFENLYIKFIKENGATDDPMTRKFFSMGYKIIDNENNENIEANNKEIEKIIKEIEALEKKLILRRKISETIPDKNSVKYLENELQIVETEIEIENLKIKIDSL